MALATLRKWGKGLVVVIPETVVQAGKLATGDEVEVNLSKQRVEIRKTTTPLEIEKLCEAITPNNLHAETSWGGPQGQEIW